jgi:hypothetical protein
MPGVAGQQRETVFQRRGRDQGIRQLQTKPLSHMTSQGGGSTVYRVMVISRER